jgi:hypothetical protein
VHVLAGFVDVGSTAEQKLGCGVPFMKIVGIFSLFTGMLLDYARGLFHILMPQSTVRRSSETPLHITKPVHQTEKPAAHGPPA